MAPSTGLRTALEAERSESFVEILRWPVEAGRRRVTLDEGRACLWILAPGELPPELGPREDWLREPVSEHELEARSLRLAGHPLPGGALEPGSVVVDDDGILEYCGRRAIVPPVEARILNQLGRRPDRVVTRRDLAGAIWGDDDRSDRALDSRIHTLRGRLAPLHLTIHTIRGHGFLLAAEPPPPSFVSATAPAPARSNPWSNS